MSRGEGRYGTRVVVAGLAAVVLGIASAGGALEKRQVVAPEEVHGTVLSTEVAVSYYNTCTSWAWSWSVGVDARLGTVFECPPGQWNLTGVTCTFDGSTTEGYGYTGELAVAEADSEGCPVGAAFASQPFLPVDGVVTYVFDVPVPSSFVVVANVGIPYYPGGNLARFVTDHPAQGPTGPPACGTCYPETRPTHSFYYGSGSVVLCPGTPFFDGHCNAELIWIAHLTGTATGTPESDLRPWSAIKALYR
jgi:hypothetical protein